MLALTRVPFARSARCTALGLALGVTLCSSVEAQGPASAPPTDNDPQGTPQGFPPGPRIDWHKGPYVAKLGEIATLNVPAGYEFADAAGARRYLELTHNPSDGSEIGVITPLGDNDANDWVVLFDFDETGFVKDDEKTSIDAPKLLESIKKGTEQENEERAKKGWAAFHINDWQTLPFYDNDTHNLTWGTLGSEDDRSRGVTINYATRYLGRRGVVRVDLITDPQQIAGTLPRFKQIMSGFAFTPGSRYADFVKGDKVAEYGLTALIAGGVATVALKTGLFAKLIALMAGLWKVIAVFFVAIGTRIKNIVAGIKERFRNKNPKISDGGQGPPGSIG